MISSILVYQIGQSRVWFSMSRDGLLPNVFSHVHPVFRTPAFSTWVAGFVVAIPSGLFDIGTLADYYLFRAQNRLISTCFVSIENPLSRKA